MVATVTTHPTPQANLSLPTTPSLQPSLIFERGIQNCETVFYKTMVYFLGGTLIVIFPYTVFPSNYLKNSFGNNFRLMDDLQEWFEKLPPFPQMHQLLTFCLYHSLSVCVRVRARNMRVSFRHDALYS